MIASGWSGGRGYVYGLRILGNGRWLYFRREWNSVTLIFPDHDEAVEVPITESFWERCPELRSPAIKEFFLRNGLVPWPKHHPPHFSLEALGGGVFRLAWLEHVPRQPSLLLEPA
jgi:hypothetical protein